MELPVVASRHPWLRFENMGLTQGSEDEYLKRLRKLYYRKVFSVPVLDFGSIGQINGGNTVAGLQGQLEMIHRGDEDKVLFRSYAWERLFRI